MNENSWKSAVLVFVGVALLAVGVFYKVDPSTGSTELARYVISALPWGCYFGGLLFMFFGVMSHLRWRWPG